ncbi:MAG: spore germination protein [Bacilli bacterium]|nr:spore germination protein [Bacilli bacterium]
MEKLGTDNQKTIKIIKTQTGSSPDIIIKEMQVCDIKVAIVFNETLSDKSIINDFVLEYLEELELSDLDTSNLFEYLEKHIPTREFNTFKILDPCKPLKNGYFFVKFANFLLRNV